MAKKIEVRQTPAGTVRMRNYISPSALSCFENDPADYFLKYLAYDRPEREGQTVPMAVGSMFDSLIKLKVRDLKGVKDDRTWAQLAGVDLRVGSPDYEEAKMLADQLSFLYEDSGWLNRVVSDISHDVEYEQWKEGFVGDVPVAGLPDLTYTDYEGKRVILDWKVNGACARGGVSPAGGYKYGTKMDSSGDWVEKKARGGWKKSVPTKWSLQVETYLAMAGWEEARCVIHQLACHRVTDKAVMPTFVHHEHPEVKLQSETIERYRAVWEFTQNPLIVLPQAICDQLQRTAAALRGECSDPVDQLLAQEREI